MAVASARRLERPRARALSLWLLARVENSSGGGLGQGLAHRHGPRSAAAAYEALWRLLRNVLRDGRTGHAFVDAQHSGLLRRDGTGDRSGAELLAWLKPQLSAAGNVLAELEDELSETFGDVGPLGSFDAACESAELRNRVFPTLARLASVRDDAELRVFARRFGLNALDEYLAEPGRSRLLIELYAQLLEGIWRRAGIEVEVHWPELALPAASGDLHDRLWRLALGSAAAYGELLESLLHRSTPSALRPGPLAEVSAARSSRRAPRLPSEGEIALPRRLASGDAWLHVPAGNDPGEPVSGIVPLLAQPSAAKPESPAALATTTSRSATTDEVALPVTERDQVRDAVSDAALAPGPRDVANGCAADSSSVAPRSNPLQSSQCVQDQLRSCPAAEGPQGRASLAPPGDAAGKAPGVLPPTAARRAVSWLRALLMGAFLGLCVLLALLGRPDAPGSKQPSPAGAADEQATNAPRTPPLREAESRVDALPAPLAAAPANSEPSGFRSFSPLAVPLESAQSPLISPLADTRFASVPLLWSPDAQLHDAQLVLARTSQRAESAVATASTDLAQSAARQGRGSAAAQKPAPSENVSNEPLPYVIDFSPIPADVTLSIEGQKITGFGTLLLEELPETVQLVAQREGYQTRRMKIARDTFTEQNGVLWRRIYVTLRTNEEITAVLDPAREPQPGAR